MNSRQPRIALLIDTRLASIACTAASLNVQLCELNQLRDRVRKAQLSARRVATDISPSRSTNDSHIAEMKKTASPDTDNVPAA
jgi:hypothetical protein